MSKERFVAPEWLTAGRADFLVDETLQGGWSESSTPLMRNASFTDFGSHEMAVPAGDSAEARAVRMHELIHARISPTSVPAELMEQLGVSPQAVRLAEEVRVNFVGRGVAGQQREWLRQAGLDHEAETVMDTNDLADGSESATAKRIVTSNSWNDALNLYLSTYNTKVHAKVKRALRKNPEWKKPFTEIDKMMTKRLGYNFSKTYSRNAIAHGWTDPFEFVWMDKKRQEQRTILPSSFMHYTLSLANVIDEWLMSPPTSGNPARSLSRTRRDVQNFHSKWETLRLGACALTENTTAFLGRRKRPAMSGKYPSRPDRLLTDPERRIFRETVRSRGGVVVFDCSGSMGITHETILDTVKQFAGATVLVYSHSRQAEMNAWVVARNGRMIAKDEFDDLPLGRGNGVDGEALRWALRQRKKGEFLMWVSDGQVTGRNDHMTRELVEECAALCHKNGIIGADTPEEAIQLLADMKRGKMPRNKHCEVITSTLRMMSKDMIGENYE